MAWHRPLAKTAMVERNNVTHSKMFGSEKGSQGSLAILGSSAVAATGNMKLNDAAHLNDENSSALAEWLPTLTSTPRHKILVTTKY